MCNFNSEECWYLHEDKSDNKNYPDNFQCYVCKNDFMSKHDLMEHKKKHQSKKIINVGSKTSAPSAWTQPLHSVPQQDFHQIQPAAAPDQEALMLTLNLINQRLQAIENKMFPELM